MDQTSERYLESKEELQRRMDDTRHSMADTMGEITSMSCRQRWTGKLMCSVILGRAFWLVGR